jgi:hypothetical protein
MDTQDGLYERALDGVRAVLAYLGHDPDTPYLADTPGDVLAGLAHVVLRPDLPWGPAALLDDWTTGRTGPRTADSANPDVTAPVRGGPAAWRGLCRRHLAPIGGQAFALLDPGPGGITHPVAAQQVADYAAWHAGGVTTAHRAAEQTAAGLLQVLGGAGGCVLVRVTQPCPHPHEPTEHETGMVEAVAGWGPYEFGAAGGGAKRSAFQRWTFDTSGS